MPAPLAVHDRDPVLPQQFGRALDTLGPPRAEIATDDDLLRPIPAHYRLVTGRNHRQPARYARRTPQNNGNAALTMSLMSDRNAVGWNSCPRGMHGKVSSART